MGKQSYKNLQKKWDEDSFVDAVERALFKFVDKTNMCWNWIGKNTSSKMPYGRISFRGKTWQAHKLSYKAFVGEITPGMLVLHHCDNAACIRPQHLYLGTYLQNQADKRNRGRCKGEKLTEEQARQIKKELELHKEQKTPKGPYSLIQIGKRYGISQSMVKQILDGKSWSWVVI